MATEIDREVAEVRREMGMIRRELHEDMRGITEAAATVYDWRRYIGLYPWAAVGAATLLGYFLVPKKQKSIQSEVARAVAQHLPVASISDGRAAPIQVVAAPAPVPAPKKPSFNLIRWGLGLLVPVALRAAQNYGTHFLANWVAQQGDNSQLASMLAAVGLGPQPEPDPTQGPPPGPVQGVGPGYTPGFGTGAGGIPPFYPGGRPTR